MSSESQWGSISFGETVSESLPTTSDPRKSLQLKTTSCYWKPSPRIAASLPEDFQLELNCVDFANGLRRFLPRKGKDERDALIRQASLGGQAILADIREMSREQSFSYHAMRLIFQKAGKLQENLCRSFCRAQDLKLSLPERFFPGKEDILPDDLGQGPDGAGQRWSVKDLVENGRQVAKTAGYTNPSPEQSIRYGLLEAARRNPLEVDQISKEEALGLIQISLFNLGPAGNNSDVDEAIDEELTERVIARFLEAVKKHIDDDTEDFHSWFYEKNDNLIRQISKQKKNGGPIERAVVRQVILEFVFHSFRYIGDCVHLQMSAFAKALSKPLSQEERGIFDLLYSRQLWLGGLPLILLHDRFPLLKEIISEMWEDPSDQQKWGVLLRLLYFHAEMIRNKRASEREYKSRKQDSHGSTPVQLTEERQPIKNASIFNDFQEVAAEFREQRGANCQCGHFRNWRSELDQTRTAASDGKSVVWIDECAKCGHREKLTDSVSKFQQVWKDLKA